MTSAIEPFLPDFRTDEGYEIINGAEIYKSEDYFEALKVLASYPRARVKRMSPGAQIEFGALIGTFVSIDRQRLISLATGPSDINGTAPATEDSVSQNLVAAVARLPGMSVFRKGHSQKLFRFISSTWGNLAIEPLKSVVNIYLLDTKPNREAFELYIASTTGPGPTGRNSNLNAVDAFRGHSLLLLKVLDESQATEILNILSAERR